MSTALCVDRASTFAYHLLSMISPQPLFTRQRLRLLIVLWVLLASLYTITYSGGIESGDTLRLLDAVSSLVDYGDSYIDLGASEFPPQPTISRNQGELPLETAGIEPMQIIASAPLYWLAKHVPSLGLVHTTYLFNVLVGATIGCVLLVYALALGYRERTALLAVIVFGVGTAIVPYSKSFFREPLMMLCLLTAALAIERMRASGFRSIAWFTVGVLALLALTLTKASGLMALPALLIIALPSLRGIDRRLLLAIGLVLVLLAALFVALGVLDVIPGLSARYDVLRRLTSASSEYLGVALHTYLLSIGGSIWGTSPVVLLAIPGMWLLLRRGQWRYPAAIVLLVLTFAVGYAVLNTVHWFGGLSWPPRFLIPVLPFLIIGALPALDWLTKHPRSVWMIVAILLLAYSVWIQLSGVALPWVDYPRSLPPEASELNEWGPGLNQIEYLRWVVIPQLWSTRTLDNAWAQVNAPLIPLLLGGVALLCGVWLWRVSGNAVFTSRSFSRLLTLFMTLAYVLIVWAGLRLLYEGDRRYAADNQALHEAVAQIETETASSDVLLLSTPAYQRFFLNYYKPFDSARVIALPLQPGEQSSPEQQPPVRSDYPDALLTSGTLVLLHRLANAYERLWVLVEFGPDLAWSTRPVERFMSTHYYPVDYPPAPAPQVRLVEYSTASAPDPFAFRGADQVTDLVYGDAVRLSGFSLPDGTVYAPGDVLPISLLWQTEEVLQANYTIAVYLSQPDSLPVTQSDWQPSGFFMPTSLWQVGAPVWDHRGLQLPTDLAPGEYQLWVKVYDNPGGSAPQDLTVTGTETRDDTIGVLPVTVEVRVE